MSNVIKLLKSGKTVFSKRDIASILDFSSPWALSKFLYRAKKSGDLVSIQRGIYALGRYNVMELACKLRGKSYISLETVLKAEWIIFQHYDVIFAISDDTRTFTIEQQEYKYSKITDTILLNPIWIFHKKNYSIATKERAICDRLYLTPWYYFDSLSWVDFEKLGEISKIYNTRVEKEVISLRKKYETQ